MTASAPCSVSGDLTIYQVQEVRDRLRTAWHDGVRRFDWAGVTALDTAGAQLLVSLHRTAGAAGEPLEWTGVSVEVRDALTLLGLRHLAVTGVLPTEGQA